ncbi:LysR family transcriptional regulator [Micromonospora sp. NPDC051300]|uniref:LysR family transcriptional regulator n=1 Tax=Micromonospora sp. NPDC051300 TaxID=3364286 RepID=UPI0037AD9D71
MDLDRVRAFAAAAEWMNFTAAAEELGLAQPSLSARIRALETDLGVELFSRRRRQVELTAAGRTFLPHARALLDLAAEARRDVLRAARPASPRRLLVTTLASSVDEVKAGTLLGLRGELPDWQVTLTGVPFRDHVSRVRDGTAEAAYLWSPYAPEATRDLRVEPVGVFRRVLAVPAGHRLVRRAEVTVDDLVGEPQVPLPDDVDAVFVAAWRLVPDAPVAVAEPAVDVAGLLRAVADGVGCCPVPSLLARTAHTPGVGFVPLRGAPPATLALAWRADAHPQVERALSEAARRPRRTRAG